MSVFDQKTVNHYVSNADKNKEDWYIGTFNTLSKQARGNDLEHLRKINRMLFGEIDQADYSQYLNPFNFKEERHKNIPGKIRNYDIIMSNVRKYIGEYVTSYQEFHVISKLPDEDNELLDAANELAYKLLSKKAVQMMQEVAGEINPNQKPVDVAGEVEEFQSRWKDNRVINDYNMLEYLRAFTKDAYIYGKAYTHWIVYGRYFMSRGIENDDVVKEVLDPLYTYPIYNDSDFVEDFDGLLHISFKTISQIKAHFNSIIGEKEMKYLEQIENKHLGTTAGQSSDAKIIMNIYKAVEGFTDDVVGGSEFASSIANVEVGTLYYKGMKAIRILSYKDILGNEFEKEVNTDYELNPMIGDISLKDEWCPTVYAQYRFGSQYSGIYTKPIELPVQRQLLNNNYVVKLPITGKVGIYPGFPNHSIPRILYPFQVTVNLLHLVRERSVVTAQGKIGVIPKELLGSDTIDEEEQMYNMLVTKKLFAVTENIPNLGNVINAIREINLSDHEHIKMLDAMIAATIELANTTIDMNRQRAGQMYASEGKGAAQEAVQQVSMGSAIINITFDQSRCMDYLADIDYSKVAWINGKKAKYVTPDRQQKFFEVNPVTHCESEFGVFVNNSVEYAMQAQQIKDYAFNLSQNGQVDEDVILDVITNKNISKLKEILQIAKALRLKREDAKFQQEQQTQQQIAQGQQQIEAAKLEFDKWKVNTECLNDLLVKEVDIHLKELDMTQEDKNNEVLSNIEERKQALQTGLNLLKR